MSNYNTQTTLGLENWSMIYINLDESIKIAKKFDEEKIKYSVSSVVYLPVLFNCIYKSHKEKSQEFSLPIAPCAQILMGSPGEKNCKRIVTTLKLMSKVVSQESNKKLINIKLRTNKAPLFSINDEFYTYIRKLRSQKNDALVVIHKNFFKSLEKLYETPRVFFYTLEIIYRMQNAYKAEEITRKNKEIFNDKMEYLDVLYPPPKTHTRSEFRNKDREKLLEKFGCRYVQLIHEIAYFSLKNSEYIRKNN